MRKVLMIMLVLTFGMTSVALAICPDVVGDWDATVNRVSYDAGSQSFSYDTGTLTFQILDQNGCLFYGFRKFPGFPDAPMTGLIEGRSIYWTVYGVEYEGYLLRKVEGLYTKIKYFFLASDIVGKGIAKRR